VRKDSNAVRMDVQIHTIRAGAIVCACTEHASVSHVTREGARSV